MEASTRERGNPMKIGYANLNEAVFCLTEGRNKKAKHAMGSILWWNNLVPFSWLVESLLQLGKAGK